MSKQTALDYYAKKDNEITIDFLEGKINQIQCAIKKTELLFEAREMMKEQIRNAYNADFHPFMQKDFEQYYNETYNK